MTNSNRKNILKNYKFPLILLGAIALGCIVGAMFGDFAMKLSPFGDIFINLMFMTVVPLVFLSVSSAVSSITSLSRLGKILKSLVVVFIFTGMTASVIMIIFVKLIPPAWGVNIPLESTSMDEVNLGEAIVNALTVSDFSGLLSRSNMLPLILFSIFFGICVITTDKNGKIAKGLDIFNKVFMKMIDYIMLYAPIGLGCYFASLTAQYGPQLIGSYARSMAVYYPLCIAYFFIGFFFYSYWSAGSMEGPRTFFRNIFNPAVTSLATCSSIATLPVNLAASERIGVPKDIREIVLPLGATAHMDGTCFSSILKISFLFGIFGKDFSGLDTYITAVLISIIAGVVMSGIPGGGLIGEMLICSIYAFPPEAFPIIATIGFLVDPPATMINSTGDSLAAMMVTRMVEGKDWLTQKRKKDIG